MKSLRKTLVFFLTVMLCIGMMVIPVIAASTVQDGLEVTLTTDKESYSQDEEIVTILTVKNTNAVAMNNVLLEILVPDGYKLAKNLETKKIIESLGAGETVSFTATNIQKEIDSNEVQFSKDNTKNQNASSTSVTNSTPSNGAQKSVSSLNTGDNNHIVFWIVFLLFAFGGIVAMVVWNRKTGKKFLSLFLCMTIVGANVTVPIKVKASESQNKIININTVVKVENHNLTINAYVKYNIENNEKNKIEYTRAEWIQTLVETCGYPERGEVTEPSYSDIEGTEYYNVIEKAVAYRILLPDSETFNPDDPATREFAAVTAVRCMGYQPNIEIECEDAGDIIYSKEAALAIETGLLSLEENKFYPKRSLTKTEGNHILAVIEDTYETTENGAVSGSDSDHKGFVFQDDVIVLDETTEYEDNGTTVKLLLMDELNDLHEGSIIVIGTSKAYKVVSTNIEEEYLVITYSVPELQEFLECIDVEGEAYMDFSRFEPAEGVSVNYNSAENGIQQFGLMDDAFDKPDTSINIGANIVLEGDIDLGNDWSLDYSFEESIPSVAYKFDIDFNELAFLPGGESFANVKNAYIKICQDATLKVGFGKDLDGNNYGKVLADDMMYKYIPLGRVPLIGADGIGIVVEIDLVMNAQGTFEFQYNLAGTLGCQVLNNRPRNISALQSSTSAGVMGEIKVGPKVGVVAEIFEKDLISFSADAGARLGGSLNVRSTGLVCFDAGLTLYAELNAFEDTLIDDWLNIKMNWKIWDEYSSPLKWKKHFENMEVVDECTYENGGTIKGTVANADNRTQYIENAKIRIYKSEDLSEEKTVYSNNVGQYTATVPGGTHLIKISADGYIPFECLETVMDKQEIHLETFLMVEGDENTSEKGTIGGNITDSVTGSSIMGVKLTIRKGWNVTAGSEVASITTDGNGFYKTELPLGNYTILMEKENYVTNHFNVAVTRKVNLNQHGTLIPDGDSSIPTGDLRIVLTWGDRPSDLDSHLWGPAVDGGLFHTYFSDKSYVYAGETQAFLDLDDTTYYGPETTTVYSMNQSGLYSFYVHDFSNRGYSSSTVMANSGAKVQVYVGEELIATYNIPTSGVGNVWHVFDFNADTRILTAVNEFSSESNADNVGSGISYFDLDPVISPDKDEDKIEQNETMENSEETDIDEDLKNETE